MNIQPRKEPPKSAFSSFFSPQARSTERIHSPIRHMILRHHRPLRHNPMFLWERRLRERLQYPIKPGQQRHIRTWEGRVEGGPHTVSSLVSPIFFPTSSFIHLVVFSSAEPLPSLDIRPGTTRGIVAGVFVCRGQGWRGVRSVLTGMRCSVRSGDERTLLGPRLLFFRRAGRQWADHEDKTPRALEGKMGSDVGLASSFPDLDLVQQPLDCSCLMHIT